MFHVLFRRNNYEWMNDNDMVNTNLCGSVSSIGTGWRDVTMSLIEARWGMMAVNVLLLFNISLMCEL